MHHIDFEAPHPFFNFDNGILQRRTGHQKMGTFNHLMIYADWRWISKSMREKRKTFKMCALQTQSNKQNGYGMLISSLALCPILYNPSSESSHKNVLIQTCTYRHQLVCHGIVILLITINWFIAVYWLLHLVFSIDISWPLQRCCRRADNILSAGAPAALSDHLTPVVSRGRAATLG